MAEKKKKKKKKKEKKEKKEKQQSNSSSLTPEQSVLTPSKKRIRPVEEAHQLMTSRSASNGAPTPVYQPLFRLPSSVSPSVSMKSNDSIDKLINFQPQKIQSAPLHPSVSVRKGLSMLEPPGLNLQKTQSKHTAPRAPSNEIRRSVYQPLLTPPSSVSPSVSMKSDDSRDEPPSFQLQKKESKHTAPRAPSNEIRRCVYQPLLTPPSSVSPSVSMKSDFSMDEPPSFQPQKRESEPLHETDSIISSVSVRSASSMYEPPSFNPQKKQSQLTEEISSCSVCEEAVKDPVRLLCGHRSCKQCVLSFRDQNGSAADYSCKTCGKKFRGEPEHQTDSEDDKKNLNLPSASRPAPQNTTGPAGREKRDLDLRSVLLVKTIKRVEMETEKLQAEKEKLQVEKEMVDLKKRKLTLEIQLLEQKGKNN
ncbi:uncharacterized protein LOC115590263 [Sparus aurata]|uniref:uncharacterized protein LOC115590263 n=1 Tax=Sparus aurata TaxID=8175 RepID=UPI0011C136C2|nr:uncharacterized protein LOC115590263 [Sparus aurata]